MTSLPSAAGIDAGAAPSADRERRLLDGVAALPARLRATAGPVDGERLLFLLGAVLCPLGFLVIMLGWRGAGGTGLVFEQIPFLISGGLGGLGLMVVGGFLYFSWWQTRLIRELRQHHDDLQRANDALVANTEALVRQNERLLDQQAELVAVLSRRVARPPTRA